ATTKMAELDSRLNHLDAELQGIKAQSDREAAAERSRVDAEARRDIEKIREMAGREIEAAKQVAMADLREFAATKAVDLAEQMIRREMTPADDANLLARVGREMSRGKWGGGWLAVGGKKNFPPTADRRPLTTKI